MDYTRTETDCPWEGWLRKDSAEVKALAFQEI